MLDMNKDGEWIPFCVTLERKWMNNEKGKSCIPKGEYPCRRIVSPKFGDTFQVDAVPDRTEILLHRGNLDDDSHGCILVAEMYGMLFDKTWGGWSPGVLASGVGFEEFLKRLKDQNEFKLVITETT